MEDLSPAGRRRVYRVLCYLGQADADLGPAERRVLADLRGRLELDEETAAALEAEARDGKGLKLKARRREAVFALKALSRMMVADGVLHPAEAARLRRVGDALGIDEAELKRILAGAVRRGPEPAGPGGSGGARLRPPRATGEAEAGEA